MRRKANPIELPPDDVDIMDSEDVVEVVAKPA